MAFLLFFVKDPRKECKPILGEVKKSDYGTNPENTKSSKKKRKRSLVLRQEKSYFKTVLFALIQPTMVLLFGAASVRHTAGTDGEKSFYIHCHHRIKPLIYNKIWIFGICMKFCC